MFSCALTRDLGRFLRLALHPPLSPAQFPLIGYYATKTGASRRPLSKLECCALFPETASAGAHPAPRGTRQLALALEVAAGTWHQGRAQEETRLSSAQRAPIEHEWITTGASQHARESIPNAALLPQRERAQAHLAADRDTSGPGLALKTVAGTSHRSRASKERGLSSVQRASAAYESTTAGASRRARVARFSAAPRPQRQ